MSDDAWIDVGASEELRGTTLREVPVGRAKIALSCVNGEFAAISGVCNHVGGPLGQGTLDGEYIVCPWHYWKFHRKTGEGEPGYEEDRVPVHDVRVEDGIITGFEPDAVGLFGPVNRHVSNQIRGTAGGGFAFTGTVNRETR